jgi:transposase
MVNDTTKLLGLEGVQVTGVELDQDGVPWVMLTTDCESARHCPVCGFRSESAHSNVATRPRDLAVAGRRTELTWRKRRWRCMEPTCPKVTFTEAVPQIPPRSRLTGRLRHEIGRDVADRGRTVVQAGRDHDVSWPTAMNAVHACGADALPPEDPQVTALGIDETRRGKAKYAFDQVTGKWSTVRDKWHVGFVDLYGGTGMLGQAEGRFADTVATWINSHDERWKAAVKFVAIDMCQIFASAVRAELPGAALVVDRFHVVQLANRMVSEVRRRVTVKVRGRRGRKGNREWELRNRLTRSAAKTTGSLLDPMIDDLKALPKEIGQPIIKAWNCKEDLMDLLALTHTNPSRHEIYLRLERFYESCAASAVPECETLAQTVSTWRREITAAILSGVSNAGSEGHNRVIKTDARCAYGYRNPVNQRLRARLATTRRGRGCLETKIQHG